MENCHPNAVRFVKYYLTITHTRWEQVRVYINYLLTTSTTESCLLFRVSLFSLLIANI